MTSNMTRWTLVVVVCSLLAGPRSGRAQSSGNTTPSNPQPATNKTRSGGSGFLCVHNCSSTKVKPYNMKDQTYSGEVVRGPRTIVAYNLNVLRYNYAVNSSVSFSQPPDIWAKLTGVASPQQPATQPTAPTQKPSTPANNLPGAPGRAALSQPGGTKAIPKKGQPPVSAETADLIQKAKVAMNEGTAVIDSVNLETSGIDSTLITTVTQDFIDVTAQTTQANTATNDVSSAGQELLSFLKATNATSAYADISRQLADAPPSSFIKGINAHWADTAIVARLKASVALRKTLLTTKKNRFDVVSSSLLTSLGAAKRDLTTASENLAAQEAKLKSSPQRTGEEELVSSTLSDVKSTLSDVKTAETDLRSASDTLNWAVAENTAMEATLGDLDPSSDKFKNFQQAHAALLDWKERMLSLKGAWDNHEKNNAPDPFTIEVPGTCDYSFATTKRTTIKITASDQLPAKTAASPSDVLSVTVECASPFAISAGVAFDTISNQQFAIQPVATPPGSTTTTNEFVLTSNSSFHAVPIAVASARLCEPSETVSFHVSFGLAGNFKSQSAGGSTAEFLIGPSLGLFRTMFITPGLYIGQRVTLGDGFKVGDSAPTNITSPPLQTSYKPAFGIAITFTKP